jgi:hypothetical protein
MLHGCGMSTRDILQVEKRVGETDRKQTTRAPRGKSSVMTMTDRLESGLSMRLGAFLDWNGS